MLGIWVNVVPDCKAWGWPVTADGDAHLHEPKWRKSKLGEDVQPDDMSHML
jgi:hypothetical protein